MSKKVLALDFQALVACEVVSATVPVHFLNEEIVQGVFEPELSEIYYKADPAHLLDPIEIDLANKDHKKRRKIAITVFLLFLCTYLFCFIFQINILNSYQLFFNFVFQLTEYGFHWLAFRFSYSSSLSPELSPVSSS